jgi:hypothetical protein
VFLEESQPVIEALKDTGRVVEIDAQGDVDNVFAAVQQTMEELQERGESGKGYVQMDGQQMPVHALLWCKVYTHPGKLVRTSHVQSHAYWHAPEQCTPLPALQLLPRRLLLIIRKRREQHMRSPSLQRLRTQRLSSPLKALKQQPTAQRRPPLMVMGAWRVQV